MAIPVFLGIVAFGGLVGWYGVSRLLPMVRAVRAGRPMVVLNPRESVLLPLAWMILSMAPLTLYRGPVRRPGRRTQWGSDAGAGLWFALAAVGMVGTSVAPIATRIAVEVAVMQRGYAACPYVGERYGVRRWLRVGPGPGTVHCPTRPGEMSAFQPLVDGANDGGRRH